MRSIGQSILHCHLVLKCVQSFKSLSNREVAQKSLTIVAFHKQENSLYTKQRDTAIIYGSKVMLSLYFHLFLRRVLSFKSVACREVCSKSFSKFVLLYLKFLIPRNVDFKTYNIQHFIALSLTPELFQQFQVAASHVSRFKIDFYLGLEKTLTFFYF